MTIGHKQIKPLTLEEFLALPETEPASEFIAGEIFLKPMPKLHHSTLQMQIATAINCIAKPAKLALAFPELRCNFANVSIVPDLVVLRWENIPFQADGTVADVVTSVPDWLIEILAPEQSPLRLMNKIGIAITNGSELGQLVIPHRLIRAMIFQK
ncbi:MAG: Uma2 family endonuclease [Pseudanabaenaceae cyanobacterium SKYGB_i_bin29]|nr:Uma2 family endonuclease [Pseudanabaenaceae cyanobacterium SKYG29]MDW8422014.1 Uma2 family endonuclease [Pseudanabaenaceae cyanobacterium SKYGB_i_bin29]